MPQNPHPQAHRRRRRRHRRRRPDDDPGAPRARVPRRRSCACSRPGGRPGGGRGRGRELTSARRRRRPSRASTSRCSRPAAAPRKELAPEAAPRGATVHRQLERLADGPRASRSSCRQVNAGRPREARGDHRQPELLDDAARAAADGAARRGRPRAGRRRHLPVGRRAPATRRSTSSRTRSGPTPRAGRRSRASTRTRSRSTPCPQIDVFLDNGYTKEEWKVVTESRKILHLPDLRVSCTAVRVPGVRRPLRGGPRRDRATRSRPSEARELFAAVPGVVVQDDPGDQRLPAGDRGRRDRRGLRRPRPAGPVGPGQPRPRVLGRVSDNLRKGAASNAVEIAELLVAARLDPARRSERPGAGPRAAGPDRVTDDERRAALEQIATEVRVCTALSAARGADEGRARRGRPRHRGRVRRRGAGLQRGPRGAAVRRPRRRAAGAAARPRSAGGATTCSSRTS